MNRCYTFPSLAVLFALLFLFGCVWFIPVHAQAGVPVAEMDFGGGMFNHESFHDATELSSFVVLAWIIWFVFQKGVPKFLEALTHQQQAFIASNERREAASILALERQRIDHKEELSEEREATKELTKAVGQLSEIIHLHDKTMREAHSAEMLEVLKQRNGVPR